MLLLTTRKSNLSQRFTDSMQLNWGNPVCQNLISYFTFQGPQAVDLVTGSIFPSSGGAYSVPTQFGMAFDGTSTTKIIQQSITGPMKDLANPWQGMSVLWVGFTPDVTAMTDDKRIASIQFDNALGPTNGLLGVKVTTNSGNKYATLDYNDNGSYQALGVSDSQFAFSNYKLMHCGGSVQKGTSVEQRCFINGLQAATNSITANTGPTYGATPQFCINTLGGYTGNTNLYTLGLMFWNRSLQLADFQDIWEKGLESLLIVPRRNVQIFQSGSVFALNSRIESQSNIEVPTLYRTFAFPISYLENQSDVRAVLGKAISLSAYLESQSDLRPGLTNPKNISAIISSQSDLSGLLGTILVGGFGALSVDIQSLAPVAYFKTYKRPIAWLKNDDDTIGESDETPQISPGYDIF